MTMGSAVGLIFSPVCNYNKLDIECCGECGFIIIYYSDCHQNLVCNMDGIGFVSVNQTKVATNIPMDLQLANLANPCIAGECEIDEKIVVSGEVFRCALLPQELVCCWGGFF